jgi:spermidine synthase
VSERPDVIARGDGTAGEVVLRRRVDAGNPVFELIVNGVFLMDTAETSTERLLAEALLSRHPHPARVLVGGLGFGFTVATLLGDARVEEIDVVELEALLVAWLRRGDVPGTDALIANPRVNVVVDDIRVFVERCEPDRYDGILLDVDNGPDFLTREANAAVYARPALHAAARALAPGGILAIWSAAPSEPLLADLAGTVGHVEELIRTVPREGREFDYHIYLARRSAQH